MKWRFILTGALVLAGCETLPVATDLTEPPPEILPAAIELAPAEAAFAQSIAAQLAAARYMEGECADGAFPGWEDLPLINCAYEVANANGEKRAGRAIMLNPSAEQLTRWIFTSCASLGRDANCRRALFEQVLAQSGGQFVVAGIVWEDIAPADGAHEGYTFRDGVTVVLEGIPNGATRQLDAGEIARVIAPETFVTASRRYARIASTSPDDYRANGGTADVGTTAAPSLAWPATVAALYRAAWNHNENELITAWARANAASLQ